MNGRNDPSAVRPDAGRSGGTVIVVGGGSAGCVLAARLSERRDRHVVLLEAGRDYTARAVPPEVRDLRPHAMFHDRNVWTGLRARVGPGSAPVRYEQGRLIGGGSSINGMNAPRGVPADFDEWVARGADGWSFPEVLEHFRRLERDEDFDGPMHGRDGPLPIRRSFRADWPPFTRAAAASAERLGFAYAEDHNATFGDGLYPIARAADPDARVSTSLAYLHDAVRARPNLSIVCGAHVDRITLDGRRATGVQAIVGGERRHWRADEVVVCAGALHSPALLMRSGIGPAGPLRDLGIEVVADLAGVGGNLQDHPFVSLARYLPPALRQPPARPIQAQAFLRATSGVGDAAQDLFVFLHNKFGWHALGQRFGMIIVCLYKASSTGRVRLASPDPFVEPDVDLGLLSDPIDLERLKVGVRLARALLGTPPLGDSDETVFPATYSPTVRRLGRFGVANRIKAGIAAAALDLHPAVRARLLRRMFARDTTIDGLLADDDRLEAWIRGGVAAAWHASGTCAMGRASDRNAVVDAGGRVHGLAGLRVADASVMPCVVRANTNLTTIMIAEKIAAEWDRGHHAAVGTADAPAVS